MILPDPPDKARPHLVADWIEISAAANVDGAITGETLVDGREELYTRGGKEPDPRKRDDWRGEAEQVWNVLRNRADLYGNQYPFEVESDALSIRTLELDDNRSIYAFLLSAANLAAFAPNERHLLTTGFERASRHAMAALLPRDSTVSIFGTSSEPGGRYGHTKLSDRLEALAVDLETDVTAEGKQHASSATDRISGDGGLDLVGWPELVGPRKRLPVYFGQCACGTDWHGKPYEVIALTWDHRLVPVSVIVPVTFIPYAYRETDNAWPDLFSVVPTVLVDRPRWLDLVAAATTPQQVLEDVPRDWLIEQLPGLAAV
jgi:hypothetical protein